MKILYVSPYLCSHRINAGCNRIFELIKRLAVKNEVHYISFMEPGEERFLTELERVCARVDVLKKDYPWRPDPLSILPSMVEEFSYQPMRRLIGSRSREEGFDILHFEYLIMAQYALEKDTCVKFLTEHELHFFSQFKDIELEKGTWDKIRMYVNAAKKKIYEINICKRFDKVITVTDKEKKVLKLYAPGVDISVVTMGVDHLFFTPEKDEEEDNNIIFIGFFGHPPNKDAVIYFYNKIFPIVRKRFPDLSFTIVGANPPDSILSLQRDKNVKVTGYVEDIRPYIRKSKVFAMPIRLGGGMRGKLFEAWAMGKPVVSTSTACRGVNVVDGENILIADNPVNFADKITELLSDSDKRRRLGENARLLVEKEYNWDILAKRLQGLYSETLDIRKTAQ